MGRSQTTGQKVNPTGPITSTFGRGEVQFFHSTTTWTIPAGVTAVRVRVWGGGANYYFLGGTAKTPAQHRAGAGGGFAIKTVTGLTPGGTVTVTVPVVVTTNGAAGGTCSFGAHVSATGGSASSSSAVGGAGSGGDFNYTGGSSNTDTTISASGGGGVANLFGNGGDGDSASQSTAFVKSRASGGGGSTAGMVEREGGGTAFARGGFNNATATILPESGNVTGSLDLIGVGGGGAAMFTAGGVGPQNGVNGGGGGGASSSQVPGRGGFPGGGTGSTNTTYGMRQAGAPGLVVVEF